jgi:hypothetical protein
MEASKKLKELILDGFSDPEFQYDFNIVKTEWCIEDFNKMIVHENAISTLLFSIRSNYIHDIKLELTWGEDVNYLIPILNELNKLLELDGLK